MPDREVSAALTRIDELLRRPRGISRLHKVQLRRKREVIVERKGADARRFAKLTSEWIDLVVRPDAVPVAKAKREGTLTAAQADRRAKGRWFSGYTRQVEVIAGGLTLRSFDVAKRERDKGASEYLLIDGDLIIKGTLKLGTGTRSIYVVTGNVRAKQLTRGDAVLVVLGTLHAVVKGKEGEGVLRYSAISS
ncbi:MAG: hypothetical protein QM817_24200 [Archangium sp.]